MDGFLKANGRISDVEEKVSKSGGKYWKIKFTIPGKQYPYSMTTFDDPNDPKCGGAIDIAYTEKESTDINPKSGKPYINRVAYLPNHVKKAQGTQTNPYALPPQTANILEEAKTYAQKLMAAHEELYHNVKRGLPPEENV